MRNDPSDFFRWAISLKKYYQRWTLRSGAK